MILNGIIWKKTDMNTNSSEYFRAPGFSIIVSSEANSRTDKRHSKKAENAWQRLCLRDIFRSRIYEHKTRE